MKILFLLLKITAGIISALIGIRFIFKLLGASSTSSFVSWVYTNSAGFISPFKGILTDIDFGDRFKLEFTSIIAIAVYIILAYLLEMILGYIEDAIRK